MLAVNTQLGLRYVEHERNLFRAIRRATGADVFETPKTAGAIVDGFVSREGVLVSVFEDKCRNLTLQDLAGYDLEWLVTEDKLLQGAHLAKSLCVPFDGWLYLIPSGVALWVRIADAGGNIVARVRTENSMTRKDVNSAEKVERTNAYISMRGARSLVVNSNLAGRPYGSHPAGL